MFRDQNTRSFMQYHVILSKQTSLKVHNKM